jgi:hypothetical protein
MEKKTIESLETLLNYTAEHSNATKDIPEAIFAVSDFIIKYYLRNDGVCKYLERGGRVCTNKAVKYGFCSKHKPPFIVWH